MTRKTASTRHQRRNVRRPDDWLQDSTLYIDATTDVREVELPDPWRSVSSRELSAALGV